MEQVMHGTIAEEAPWMVKYLINKEDAQKYKCCSSQKIGLKCPNCNKIFNESIAHAYKNQLHERGCPSHLPDDSIRNKAPWMMPYLLHEEDCDKYIVGSNKEIDFRCIDCGHIRHTRVVTVYLAEHYFCPMCNDGISYPNKFLRAFLNQLNIEYETEYKRTWTQGKVYDAYFEYNNKKYVVEMDGRQHFTNSFITYEQQCQNDELKDRLAVENNCIMIRINCYYSTQEYISNNIKNSLFNELFDLSNIDWNLCDQSSVKSDIIKVCNYFNEHPDLGLTDIAKELQIPHGTVYHYIVKGNECGLCNYDLVIEKDKRVAKSLKGNIKNGNTFQCDIYRNDDNLYIGHFTTVAEATRYINEHYELDKPIGSATFRTGLKYGQLIIRGYRFENVQFPSWNTGIKEKPKKKKKVRMNT